MTQKSHLTKSRNVSTKFQFQPFNIAGLYKQACQQQLLKISRLAVILAIPVSSAGYYYALKLIHYLNIYIKAKKKEIENNTQLLFQLFDIKGRNTWYSRGHLKITRILADMYCMFVYLFHPMAVRSHCFEVYFVHTLSHVS